jgi:hypothetical protein
MPEGPDDKPWVGCSQLEHAFRDAITIFNGKQVDSCSEFSSHRRETYYTHHIVHFYFRTGIIKKMRPPDVKNASHVRFVFFSARTAGRNLYPYI